MAKSYTNLERLYETFYADSFDDASQYDQWELDLFKKMQIDLGVEKIPENVTNHMAYLLDQMYETDNSKVMVSLLNAGENGEGYGINYDTDYIVLEFEEGDWFDDNEEHEIMEETYGREGYNLYRAFTKNYQHDFREMKPFSNGIEYDGSELIK